MRIVRETVWSVRSYVIAIGLSGLVAFVLATSLPSRGGSPQANGDGKVCAEGGRQARRLGQPIPGRRQAGDGDGHGREGAIQDRGRLERRVRGAANDRGFDPAQGLDAAPSGRTGRRGSARRSRRATFWSSWTARRSTRPSRTPKWRIGSASWRLKQANEELPILEKALPVDLAAAERTKIQADEDLKRFLEIDKPHSIKSADFSVKRSNEYLEYAKEELRQLEKMYRSKDLTEETEEIILRRQRFQVENSEFALKEAELHRNQTLKVDLPRQEERTRESAVKHAIDLEKARATLPLNLNQKRLAVAKLKHELAKGAEKLADLRHDRDAMTVHAPADGLVYFGRCDHGHWASAAAVASKLHWGGTILPDEVFMTIVAPRPVDIRATVDEKDLAALTQRGELKGLATSTLDPARRLPARLSSVVPVPHEAGKFEAVIAVEIGADLALLKPGMACSIKFVPYRKDEALTVPATAMFEDESDDALSHYVYLARADRNVRYPKRRITTGKTAQGKTEILAGLAEGDEILTAKP